MSTPDPNAPVVLVTGGSRGVGLALVRAFHEAGYRVAATATTERGAKAGAPALALACDVAARPAVDAMVARVTATLGRLDVVVNNAGVAGTNALTPADDARWTRIIDVNLHGTNHVTTACLPHLPDGSGRIIQISSILGLIGTADQTAYCAAKHGVVGFTRALALFLAKRRITVNAICPGWIDTDMARARAVELGTTVDALAAGVPLGRMATPDDVAALAVFLASPRAAMITGTAIPLDGGTIA